MTRILTFAFALAVSILPAKAEDVRTQAQALGHIK
jgi:hypothetical protein